MTARHAGSGRIADPWTVSWDSHRSMWVIWRNESPAVAFCLVQKDADRIAQLLNEANHE